jgi:Ala-tRNA(Pro) deacylase
LCKTRNVKRIFRVKPGSVTPLALINDIDNKLPVILDNTLLSYDVLNFHPLRNDATMTISKNDFNKFISYLGNFSIKVSLDLIKN